jgi:hypothetical protein
LPQCIDPCEENPELEECQEPLPPEDPCEENPDAEECKPTEELVAEEEEEEEEESNGVGTTESDDGEE